jgi:hypothetical protein
MPEVSANLEVLSTRPGFNSAVAHINEALDMVDSMEENANLGDLLYELGDSSLTGERIALFLRMILVDKLGYQAVSTNLATVAADPPRLAGEFARWKGVDLVAAYHHPEMGLLAANPKQAAQLAGFGLLRKHELLVIYAGKCRARDAVQADKSCLKAAKLAAALFEGAKASGKRFAVPAELLRGSFTVKKTRKVPAKAIKARRNTPGAPVKKSPAAVPARMTPRYSVTVTNELFHNGNVEAWKRIIDSYKTKYPALQVYIYYEGERIRDINSLFMWGKVKHGSAIQFVVAGNGIRDVAKLQHYLAQGASDRFEVFIRNAVSDVLRLF